MKRLRRVAGFVILMIAVSLSLVRLWNHQEDVLDLLGLAPVYVLAPIDRTQELWYRPLPREEVSLERRLERARANSDRYFDSNRAFEPAYVERIRRHYLIQRYLTSTRRNDPEYQKVMQMISRRGYGLKEWFGACNTILNFQIRAPIRDSQHRVGASAWEAYQLYAVRQGFDYQVEQFAKVFGLLDPDFFQELLAVPLGIKNHEPILGFPGQKLEVGDRFYTDEDWLTPEIAAAQGHYDGLPRSERSQGLRHRLGEFVRRSNMRALGLGFVEERQEVQDLIGFGMIDPEDLEGVEVVEKRDGTDPFFLLPKL